MTNLRYDDTEEALRANLRAMLATHSPWTAVLARVAGTEEPYDRDLWDRLTGELGLGALAVPAELGGAGAGFREVAVVLEELGRAVAPVPYLGSVLATRALLSCDDPDLLGQLATENRGIALAVPFSAAPGVPVHPVAVWDGSALYGTVTTVADALAADLLLVPATDGLYVAQARAPGVAVAPVVSLDATRPLCDIVFAHAPARRIAGPDATARALTDALTAGAALLASEQVGVAQWCLDTTVGYLRERRQFGRPVGSFQALKHRLADVWVEITEARAVARYAADCLATGDPDTELAAALAQAHCAAVAVHAAQECVQLHGGIGFTWEHPAHLYLKRAKSAALAFGSADRHRSTVARLVDLPAPTPSVSG
ncbi:acyl-CoA dehydrogenase family protein [Plantactinospora soyae]|uniref:Alkylation response protein AidB-like acyl-CoA dehydrogenase n=1 Tax=Plantactinospora soyae TaxID=1544732 RepID=A0A927M9Z4_9ACTN|nr:acyl-CoA dehydrogenase family protein [Plantactinospora soyae]MBE1489837.1 alkylation response protein AidB-like acyl-CoA dehydrogenase [Plantactinospora soyae]